MTSPPSASPSPSSAPASSVDPAGIGLTGVGGSTINASEAAQALVGGPLTADRIGEAAELAAQAARPRTDHRGSAVVQAPHRAHLRRADPRPRRRQPTRGRPDMTSLFEEIPVPAGRRCPGPARHAHRQRRAPGGRGRAPPAAGPPAPPGLPADRHPHRLRHHELRRLHRAVRRHAGQELHDARRPGRRPRGHHRRGPGHGERAAPHPGGLQGRARPPVRLLHARA